MRRRRRRRRRRRKLRCRCRRRCAACPWHMDMARRGAVDKARQLPVEQPEGGAHGTVENKVGPTKVRPEWHQGSRLHRIARGYPRIPRAAPSSGQPRPTSRVYCAGQPCRSGLVFDIGLDAATHASSLTWMRSGPPGATTAGSTNKTASSSGLGLGAGSRGIRICHRRLRLCVARLKRSLVCSLQLGLE